MLTKKNRTRQELTILVALHKSPTNLNQWTNGTAGSGFTSRISYLTIATADNLAESQPNDA